MGDYKSDKFDLLAQANKLQKSPGPLKKVMQKCRYATNKHYGPSSGSNTSVKIFFTIIIEPSPS